MIGDVVGSRTVADRAGLHRRLTAVLDLVNEELAPVAPLRLTVGDEYQGTFATLGEALSATLLIRVRLLPDCDVRHGIGVGAVRVLSEEPRIEDGPGWWAARAAIEVVSAEEQRPGVRSLRTAYAREEGADGPDPLLVNPALRLRDHLLTGMSERSVSVLRGLLDGRTQQEIAADEGISASAVSQRVRNDGVAVLLAAHRDLGGVG